ncbi:MAG TPA: 2Fe-2S iron-sulfur cluster-binding protein, partial [Dokdonella sp.]
MQSIDETDLGTPASSATAEVALSIDGRAIRVRAGTSVLRAAAEAGIDIPRLCATDLLEPFGSCRVCLVQIEGVKGYPASCTTPVADGMRVTTRSDRLDALRRGVLELYLSDHPPDAGAAVPGLRSELEAVVDATGLREVRYGFDGANHVRPLLADGRANPAWREPDSSNPYFRFDPAACIVCSR